MTDSDINPDFFRQLLQELRAELTVLQQTGAEAAQTVELDPTRVGRLSRMDALQAQAMSEASNRRRALHLQGIEAALRRIDKGDYGFCVTCEKPIDPRRLKFDPTLTLCITCASSREG